MTTRRHALLEFAGRLPMRLGVLATVRTSTNSMTRLVLVGMPAGPACSLGHAEQARRLLSREREPQLLSSTLIDLFLASAFLGRAH